MVMNFDKGESKQIMDTPTETPIAKLSDTQIRQELQDNGVTLHHKTGSGKLADTLVKVRAGTYTAPEPAAPKAPATPVVKNTGPTEAAVAAMRKATTETKEQRAMKLIRVIVTANDPLMSQHQGLIFTVGSSAVNNGRMIKKYVPFNNQEGWHVPKIIYDQMEAAEMQKFRQVTMPDGNKTMQSYIAKKFNVQVLDPLTQGEMDALAASQQAKGGMQV